MSRHCQIIPPFLLDRIADAEAVGRSRSTLAIDSRLREQRMSLSASPPMVAPAAAAGAAFSVFTSRNGPGLPGELVRRAGDPASGDVAVDEAYAGVEATLAMFAEVYGRSSYDDRGAPVISTVHYERDYDNAFWNGDQLVFGDGDGTVFGRFTRPVDVLAHELTHAVTQYTANLTYQGQSGALNESVSDAFGSCLKQRVAGQTAADADWLIGAGIFLPSVQGVALRSMKAPGTAYDDPTLGRDPQAASMADYDDTADDNGGVHINSGIPNRAFQLAATGIGGTSWDGAGKVWYAALTSGLAPDVDFAGFAAATVAAARTLSAHAEAAVTAAWTTVGVTPVSAATGSAGTPAGTGSVTGRVVVTRTGGFAGVRRRGEIALGEDSRTQEVAPLLDRIDLRGLTAAEPQPDRFVYTFDVRGEQAVVGEVDLTPDLRQLATLLLPD